MVSSDSSDRRGLTDRNVVSLTDEIEACSLRLSTEADAGATWGQAVDGCTDGKDFARRAAATAQGALWLPLSVALLGIAGISLSAGAGDLPPPITLSLLVLTVVFGGWFVVSFFRRAIRNGTTWTELSTDLGRIVSDLATFDLRGCDAADRQALLNSSHHLAHVMRFPRSTGGCRIRTRPGIGPLTDLLSQLESGVVRLEGQAPQEPVPAFDELADLLATTTLYLKTNTNNKRTSWAICAANGRVLGSFRTRTTKTRWRALSPDPDSRDWHGRPFSLHTATGERVFHVDEDRRSGVRSSSETERSVWGVGNIELGSLRRGEIYRDGQLVLRLNGAVYTSVSSERLATHRWRGSIRVLTFDPAADDVSKLLILADWGKVPQEIDTTEVL